MVEHLTIRLLRKYGTCFCGSAVILSHVYCLVPKHCSDWTRMRLSLEEIMGSAPVANNITFARDPSTTQQTTQQESQMLADTPLKDDQAGSKKKVTGKRKTSPVSTPDVAAPNYPVMTLVEQRMDLEMRNRILRNDNKRLETLLVQARRAVARSLSDDDNSVQPSR